MRLQEELREARREIDRLNRRLARADFEALLDDVVKIDGCRCSPRRSTRPTPDTMREMADWFRDKMPRRWHRSRR